MRRRRQVEDFVADRHADAIEFPGLTPAERTERQVLDREIGLRDQPPTRPTISGRDDAFRWSRARHGLESDFGHWLAERAGAEPDEEFAAHLAELVS